MGTLTEEIFSYKLGRTVEEGETVVVDVDHVMSTEQTFQAEPLTPFVARIVAAGGIIEYIRQEGTLR